MIHNQIASLISMPARLANAEATPEETLVADERDGVTPAQMVERRLILLLHDTPLPRASGETFGPRRTVSYASPGDTQAGRKRILELHEAVKRQRRILGQRNRRPAGLIQENQP
jgi:hypothetical protein